MAYATVAQVRAMDGMNDPAVWPDATLTEAITWATDLIDSYTGTSWEHKAFNITVSGTNTAYVRLQREDATIVLFPRTLTSCTIDGVAQDIAGWRLLPEGYLWRDEGVFTYTRPGFNVTIVGTAGAESTCPTDISWACRTLARQYALDLVSRVPDRALQIQNDFGSVTMAQAGGVGRPTSLPEVNAVLGRRRHRPIVAL